VICWTADFWTSVFLIRSFRASAVAPKMAFLHSGQGGSAVAVLYEVAATP
jgi:hypothetical protein